MKKKYSKTKYLNKFSMGEISTTGNNVQYPYLKKKKLDNIQTSLH